MEYDQLLYNVYVLVLVGVVFVFAFCKYFRDCCSSISRIRRRHHWKLIDSSLLKVKYKYCSICESVINVIGFYCDYCNLHADNECLRTADSQLMCKPTSTQSDTVDKLNHHWVKGNVTQNTECCVCDDRSVFDSSISLLQCSWCQSVIHSKCQKLLKKEKCDFGIWKQYIIPPWCIKKGQVFRSLTSGAQSDLRIRNSEWLDWTPLVVISNPKSGSGEGEVVLSEFRKILNPIQVINLLASSKRHFQIISLIESACLYVVVCGGDGTITSIVSQIQDMNISTEIIYAIIPSGTGNDLSRVLEWGNEFPLFFNPNIFLEKLTKARKTKMDRWSVEIQSKIRQKLHFQQKSLNMYNYVSIGVDAQVTYNFHEVRKRSWFILNNRIVNKLFYLIFGTQEIVSASYRNLNSFIEVYLDGEIVVLPDIQSIVVLNINSWGAGVDLWELAKRNIDSERDREQQKMNDMKLEVIGIESSFQMAKFQMGLDMPKVIGQARHVRIVTTHSAAMQVDGEPWNQCAASIDISFKDQINILHVCN